MKNERSFFRCESCGNIVGIIEDGGGTLVCCGKEMRGLKPNAVEAAKERHVPAIKRDGNKLVVQVGALEHPMTEEHSMMWIAVAQGNVTQRARLEVMRKPRAEFFIDDGSVTVYAYCNQHGLWSAEA